MRPSRTLLAACACLLLAATAAGCGSDDDSSDASDTTSTTDTTASDTSTTDAGGSSTTLAGGNQQVSPDPATPISLRTGERATLELEANPTTGYTWEITIADESVAEKVSDEYQAPSGGAMGASGLQVVEIQGVGDGQTTVEAVYVRPFEPDQPGQTETWTIEVGD